ncbi:MAG TPA: DUF2071 domain-containing protein [Ignavibacteria bacterium]|nr:DUF2071 domain-containing protein [Bacteroidota bacterium]HRE09882.1 DUF2071 domain-containing protein [Ignavibacteria bacterium]HRF66429.1 DUF2071 domain-containing protein [Ignavibacteria bacterium]HRJ05395.1 DUF2071 domain-containing protein [Ignavibacteria bacterium]
MTEPKLFLRARWQDLVLITYDVDPELIAQHIPRGLEPDTIDGRAFISLVAFDFLDTKIKGVKVPFHVNFPEINLRVYVKNADKRGVVFVREFVPKAIIPLVANTLYNENYKAITMSSEVRKNGSIFLNHKIKILGKFYEINVEAENKSYMPEENSTEHFFKEHEWGFGTSRDGNPLIYKVEHPWWNVYPVVKFQHNFDFDAIYGKKWAVLNGKQPYNVTFAQGSVVKVFEGKLMEQTESHI